MSQTTIKRLLIANRGEIARRVIRTAKVLGIHTIAIYSEADANALHVSDADTAIAIGGNTAQESYLDQQKVLAAAKQSQADAIHPGYGFLSENASFAEACQQANIIFVGPSGKAMQLMGDKAQGRIFMQQSGVPVLPGFDEKADATRLQQEADHIGYPLLIKAVAGGGGKGMREVSSSAQFAEALAAAQREAKHAFGDDQVLLERYLPTARHVEVQVFADTLGNAVYLFERDCSVQRRHQKVIEEAPAPNVSDELRQKMGEAAVTAAKAIGYVGAGTVEFLLAPDDSFYFMEMNTRLQVEHPVTEAITHTDLVAWQLAVAEGKPLPLTQEQLNINGHAFEVRLYAEDPWNGFLPAAGPIKHLVWPADIRIDTGVQQGDEVTSLYDPMIAKLITHGTNRDEARLKMIAALDQLQLSGLRHNAGFLRQVLVSDVFANADLSTRLLDHNPKLSEQQAPSNELQAIAATLITQHKQSTNKDADPWGLLTAWRPLGNQLYQRSVRIKDDALTVKLTGNSATVNSHTQPLSYKLADSAIQLTWGEATATFSYWHHANNQEIVLFYQGQDYPIQLKVEAHRSSEINSGYTAPMNGTLLIHHIKAGDKVKKGEALVTVEAMKMEHTIHALTDGKVLELLANPGDTVAAGTELLTFEETS